MIGSEIAPARRTPAGGLACFAGFYASPAVAGTVVALLVPKSVRRRTMPVAAALVNLQALGTHEPARPLRCRSSPEARRVQLRRPCEPSRARRGRQLPRRRSASARVVESAVVRALFPEDRGRAAPSCAPSAPPPRSRRSRSSSRSAPPSRRSRRPRRRRRRTSRSGSSPSPAPRPSSWRTRWASTPSTASTSRW